MMTFSVFRLLELAFNVGSATICFVMALVLWFFRTDYTAHMSGYCRLRRYLSLAALSSVVLSALFIMLMCQNHDFTVLDSAVVPAIYYVQLHMATVCMLQLIRYKGASHPRRLLYPIPMCVLVMVHVVAYLIYCGGRISFASYSAFIMTPLATTVSVLMLIDIAIALVFCIWKLLREARHYDSEIDAYFSGQAAIDGKTLSLVLRCFVAYFVLAGINFAWGGAVSENTSFRVANVVLLVINTSVFVVAGVIIINLHTAYFNVAPAFELHDREEMEAAQDDDRKEAPAVAATESKAGVTSIDERVGRWAASADKPYLREGITLASVAADMGIGTRLLSAYINKVHQQNFNTWVNSLRIEEVKRLLSASPTMTMSEIATRTGFTDAPAMTKVFKRFVDLTPSTYREKVKAV